MVESRRVRPPAPVARWWARLWALPAWAHAVGLSVVLLALVPVVGPSQSFVADEGAAVIQARSLAEGGGWIVEHPFPEVDPEAVHYPVINAERGERGFAPLAKHPAYSLLAAGAYRLGGVAAIVLLSLAGTVAAASVAGGLAGRLDRVLVRPAIWAVGLGSPLLFDGYLAMGHTLGAALAGGAVLVAATAVRDRRPVAGLWVAPLVAAAVLLRSEAVLFAVSLAVAAGLTALRWRAARRPALVIALTTVVGAGAAHAAEAGWVGRLTGGAAIAASRGLTAAPASPGFLQERFDGFALTWLTPGYGPSAPAALALLVMLAAVARAAVRARTRPGDRTGIVVPAVVAAVAAVGALAVAPANVVPGLLLAFPLAPAGLLVLRRDLFRSDWAALAGATTLLFALAVVATQYSVGGSGEWGGRYFALGLPVAVPFLLAALHRQGRLVDARARRVAAVALLVCSAALSGMAVASLRANHLAKARLAATIERVGGATGEAAPVVVTTWVAGARSAWPTFDGHRWLYTPPDGLEGLVGRLGAAGIDRFVFVTTDLERDRPGLPGVRILSVDGPVDRRILLVEIS